MRCTFTFAALHTCSSTAATANFEIPCMLPHFRSVSSAMWYSGIVHYVMGLEFPSAQTHSMEILHLFLHIIAQWVALLLTYLYLVVRIVSWPFRKAAKPYRCVCITGATSGIGAALAEHYAKTVGLRNSVLHWFKLSSGQSCHLHWPKSATIERSDSKN